MKFKKQIFFFVNLLSLFINTRLSAEYSVVKISNDECLTTAIEGGARIYARGNSGPYTIYGPNNVVRTINQGQTSTYFGNLSEGINQFIVKNSYGCETILTVKILKVNCGECPTNIDATYNDNPGSGTNSIATVSAANLLILKNNFTSDFLINSDLLSSKICIKDACLNRGSTTPGLIYYSNINELKKRVVSKNKTLKVKLFKVTDNSEIIGIEQPDGRVSFTGLSSGQYQLKVILINNTIIPGEESSSTIVLTDRIIMVNQKECNKVVNGLAPQNDLPDEENLSNNLQNEVLSQNELLTTHNIGFTVFPNPVQDILSIQVETEKELKATISLLNSLGEEIYKQELTVAVGIINTKLSMATLAFGIYTLVLKYQDNIIDTKRITKTN